MINRKIRGVRTDELIVCAAIKFFNICDPDIEMVIPSIRHYDPLCNNILDNMEYYEWEEFEQGFLTNKGRFVDRKEALAIAKANNQIRYSIGYKPDKLYSEMLY